MKSFDETPLDNPVWYSLTEHQFEHAIDYGNVKFYHPDYTPFGAFVNNEDTSNAINAHSKLIKDFLNTGRDEFYDLSNDPQETTNLILGQLSAKHKAIIHRFEQIIIAKMQTTNDPIVPLL